MRRTTSLVSFIVCTAIILFATTHIQRAIEDIVATSTPSIFTTTPTSSALASVAAFDSRIKNSDCTVHGGLPDHACTPGAIFASTTVSEICTPGYSASVRDVSQATKNQVYAEYGIATHVAGEYEVDHLISLELGGSNDIANLWPEAASPNPGFREKDAIENYLHAEVCAGRMPLREAQQKIATDWLQVRSAAQ